MGFKDEIRERAEEFESDMRDLRRRVSALEVGLRNLRPVAEAEAPAARTDTPARSGVDYGAVAFGLADMRRKLAAHLPAHEVNVHMRDAVAWFAACFAGDPSFDAAEFTAKANG